MEKTAPNRGEPDSNQRVVHLFDTLKTPSTPPDKGDTCVMGWNPSIERTVNGLNIGDVPALLELADSKKPLYHNPVNMLSSRWATKTTEGIVALWLIEGIRTGRLPYPTLNPELSNHNADPATAGEVDIQKQATSAYRRWWNRKRLNEDPLEGTGLAWF